ncbi:calpain-like cysteine peptidase [Leishmania donovani]|uniref:Calpain-like_cysteine_peptidase_putative/GeneDB:L mjF.31.0390 n=1 Tax=Leishmania donovani TaxID=5661 RepID=A0A6J8FHG1_LEIDO|nr:calpain-like cysteine peptidase [Leishmania donovani]VDZ47063.1 calpain-like_cysteine_peptidase_putative/GeneDB:LmjF.31.0390 [Leishmania donovani]
MPAATAEPQPFEFPPGYVMPLPTRPSKMDEDTLHPVRVPTPLPDLLPRSMKDIQKMRNLQSDGDTAKKYVPPRRDLPPPYVNDDECDEFEDKTIDTTILNMSEKDRTKRMGHTYQLNGPSVEGDVTPVFENGLLFKVVTPDGSWYYYNDTDKYEMHVKFTFGAKSDLQPGEKVDMYVMSTSELSASLVVFPGETTKLVAGKINGFKCSAKAVPLNDDKRDILYGEVNDRIADDLMVMAQAIGVREDDLTEEKVLAYCEENEKPYIDCDFRPCDYSLYRADVDTYLPRFIPWHRPSTWIPEEQLKEVRLFRRDILPSQVTHGSIGDTYLVSAIAALTDASGDRLHDLFRHPVSAANGKIERALGAYWVTINFNGWWLPVLLDDFLPATRDGPEFARCAVDIRRMWVALLEKTYAKVHGSYANIASGDPLEPLSEFTGFPVTRYESFWEDAQGGDDMLFQEMLSYNRMGHLQVLCTPSDGGEAFGNANVVSANPELEATYEKMGLLLHHGYAVLQTEYFEDLDLRLLRVRNPWGNGSEWTGAWSKDDKRWSKYPSVRNACYRHGGSPTDADRTFWVEWSDALKIFSGGGCCHLRTPWFDYRARGEFAQGIPTVSFEVNVSAPTEAYITLSQEDERDDPSLEYHALLLSVFRHSGKKEKLDATSNSLVEKPDRQLKFNFSRDVAMKYTFLPEHSPYFVIPRIHDPSVTKPYVMGLLCDTYVGNGIKVEFKRVDRNCRVFANMPSFAQAGMMEDTAAEYQIRTPRQPIECIGEEIVDERLREFGILEE